MAEPTFTKLTDLAAEKLGGKVLGNKRRMGEGYYCLIQDPAGAYVMLSE